MPDGSPHCHQPPTTLSDPLALLSQSMSEQIYLFSQEPPLGDKALPPKIYYFLQQLICIQPFNLLSCQSGHRILNSGLTQLLRKILQPIEQHYQLCFNYEQRCWFAEQLLKIHSPLSNYHRLSITILTGYHPEQEKKLQRQLRVLVDYPLQINYLPVQGFQAATLDDNTLLVISSYYL